MKEEKQELCQYLVVVHWDIWIDEMDYNNNNNK